VTGPRQFRSWSRMTSDGATPPQLEHSSAPMVVAVAASQRPACSQFRWRHSVPQAACANSQYGQGVGPEPVWRAWSRTPMARALRRATCMVARASCSCASCSCASCSCASCSCASSSHVACRVRRAWCRVRRACPAGVSRAGVWACSVSACMAHGAACKRVRGAAFRVRFAKRVVHGVRVWRVACAGFSKRASCMVFACGVSRAACMVAACMACMACRVRACRVSGVHGAWGGVQACSYAGSHMRGFRSVRRAWCSRVASRGVAAVRRGMEMKDARGGARRHWGLGMREEARWDPCARREGA
jgi:hypothetical protein